jgi:phospholipid/cholesterol/gamma-HCH transport system substrate-binding protein
MKRTVKVGWGNLKVGLLITLAIAALLWASFVGGGTSIFEPKINYEAYFTNMQGLVTGSPVWISGVEVGNVYSIKFVNYDSAQQILVKFRILNTVQHMITADATARLGTIGLIGDKYIEIEPGSMDQPMLAEGSVIKTVQPVDISAAFTAGQKAMISTEDLANNLNQIITRIKDGKGTIGKAFVYDTLYNEITILVANLALLVGDMQVSHKKIIGSIENISNNLDGIADKVNANQGTLGRIISDPSLWNHLNSSTGRIDSILARINRGDGTAGAMVNDDRLYEDIRNLIVRVDNLVADIEKNPRKYFKVSVF